MEEDDDSTHYSDISVESIKKGRCDMNIVSNLFYFKYRDLDDEVMSRQSEISMELTSNDKMVAEKTERKRYWEKKKSVRGYNNILDSLDFQEICPSDSDVDQYYTKSPKMTERLFKVIIIGDPTVGKTSFVQRYVNDTFKRDYKGTVGVDFALKILKWSDTETVKLQLWDIAGQERFTWMTRVYYKDAHGCIIMFDITNKASFLNTLKWKKDVEAKCQLEDGKPLPCMLLANKCDLGNGQVDQADIESLYKDHNFIGWTEISAKDGLMIDDSMKFLIDTMMNSTNVETFNHTNGEGLHLHQKLDQPEKCSC